MVKLGIPLTRLAPYIYIRANLMFDLLPLGCNNFMSVSALLMVIFVLARLLVFFVTFSNQVISWLPRLMKSENMDNCKNW